MLDLIEEQNNNSNFFENYDEKKLEEENKAEKIKEQKINIIKDNILFCKKCNSIPEIIFENKQFITLICKCQNLENYTITEFLNNYLINKIEKKEEPICKNHNKKYELFCQDCFVDICSDCISKTENHTNHSFDRYLIENDYKEIKKIIENSNFDFIKYIKISNSNLSTNDDLNLISKSQEKEYDQNEDNAKLMEIFMILLFTYDKYPCRNAVLNIQNSKNFWTYCKNEKGTSVYEYNKYIEKKNIKIEFVRQIAQNKSSSFYITSIDISEQNFNNLTIFKNLKLPNLIILKLIDNNIEDINPLTEAEFGKLDLLNLDRNKIHDDMINCLKKILIKNPNLGAFSIFLNYINDYSIFNEVSKFKKLRIFRIGSNRIYKNIDKIQDILEFPCLTQLGVTNGVFNDDSIKLFKYFKFNSLKILYLQANSLTSLEFLKYFENKCPNLQELWLYNNCLSEYDLIGNFKTLKKIHLENNQIRNIDNLIEFIKQFENLEEFNLSKNKIDLNDSKNKNIIENIKKIEKLKFFI